MQGTGTTNVLLLAKYTEALHMFMNTCQKYPRYIVAW